MTFWCVSLTPTSASLNSPPLIGVCRHLRQGSFIAKCRWLVGSTTSNTRRLPGLQEAPQRSPRCRDVAIAPHRTLQWMFLELRAETSTLKPRSAPRCPARYITAAVSCRGRVRRSSSVSARENVSRRRIERARRGRRSPLSIKSWMNLPGQARLASGGTVVEYRHEALVDLAVAEIARIARSKPREFARYARRSSHSM